MGGFFANFSIPVKGDPFRAVSCFFCSLSCFRRLICLISSRRANFGFKTYFHITYIKYFFLENIILRCSYIEPYFDKIFFRRSIIPLSERRTTSLSKIHEIFFKYILKSSSISKRPSVKSIIMLGRHFVNQLVKARLSLKETV